MSSSSPRLPSTSEAGSEVTGSEAHTGSTEPAQPAPSPSPSAKTTSPRRTSHQQPATPSLIRRGQGVAVQRGGPSVGDGSGSTVAVPVGLADVDNNNVVGTSTSTLTSITGAGMTPRARVGERRPVRQASISSSIMSTGSSAGGSGSPNVPSLGMTNLQELLEQVDDRELSDMVEITKKLSAGKAKDVLKQLEGKPTTTASSSSALSAIGTNASSTSSTTAGTATGVSDDTQYRADKMKQDMNQRYDNLYAVLNNNQQYNPLDILRKKNSDAGNGGGAGGGVSSATTLGSGSKSGTIRSKKGHAGAGDVWRVAPGEIGTTTWTSASSSQLIPVEVGAGENGRVPGSAASGTGGGTSTSQDLLSPGSATSATSTPSPASRRNGDGTMSEAATPTTADTKGNKKWSDIFAKRVKKQTSVASTSGDGPQTLTADKSPLLEPSTATTTTDGASLSRTASILPSPSRTLTVGSAVSGEMSDSDRTHTDDEDENASPDKRKTGLRSIGKLTKRLVSRGKTPGDGLELLSDTLSPGIDTAAGGSSLTIRSPTKRAESTRSGGRRRAADDTSTVASGQGGGDDPTHEESYGRFKYQRNLYFFDTLERATPRRAHKKVKADGTGASAAADDGTSVFAKYHRSARRTPTARTVSALYDTLLLRSQQRAAEVQALHTHLDQRVRASMSIIDRISNTDHQQLRSRKDMLLAAISALSTHLRQLGEPIHQCELEHAQLMAVVSSTSSLLNEIASDLNDHLQPKLARITAKVQHLMAVRTGRGDATEFGWMVLAIALNFAANFTWWVFATVRGVKRLFWRGATAELLRNGDQQGATMGGVVNASGEDVSAVAGWTGSNARLGGKRFPMAVSSSDVTTTTLMSTRTSPSRDAAGASAVFGMNRRVRVVDPKEESGGNVAKRLQE